MRREKNSCLGARAGTSKKNLPSLSEYEKQSILETIQQCITNYYSVTSFHQKATPSASMTRLRKLG